MDSVNSQLESYLFPLLESSVLHLLLDLAHHLFDTTRMDSSILDQALNRQSGNFSAQRVEAVAGMTAEEAKNALIQSIKEQALGDAAMLAKRLEEEARETASREARMFLPSLPMIRPFISSEGRSTTETVDSTTCSAAQR